MATRTPGDESTNPLQHEPTAQVSPASASRTAPAGPRAVSAPSRGASGKERPEGRELLLAMAPLVKQVASEMRHRLPAHVEMDDLVSAGTLGLVDALRKFDPSRKVKLESYARHRIKGGILDALRSLDPATRDMRRRTRRVEETYHLLEATLGRPVKDEEIAQALGISLKAWHRWAREIHALPSGGWRRRETASAVRMRPVKEEGGVAVSQADPFDLCYRREQRDLLKRELARLPQRERQILTLYYQQDLTMRQIAARLNVDESRISQLHAEALRRLRGRVQASLRPPRQRAMTASSPAAPAGAAGKTGPAWRARKGASANGELAPTPRQW